MGSFQRSRKVSKRNKKSKVMKWIHASRKITNECSSLSMKQNDHTYVKVIEETITSQNALSKLSEDCHNTTSQDGTQHAETENSEYIISGNVYGNSSSACSSDCKDVLNDNLNVNDVWGTDEEFESIMAHELAIEKEASPSWDNIIPGNRVVNLAHVLQWALPLQKSHNTVCTCGVLYLWKEVMDGLVSSLHFKCTMCNRVIVKTTDVLPEKKKEFPTNVGAVWGTITSGSSHACLEQVLTSMDIPPLTFRKFAIIEKSLGKLWHDESVDSMLEAGREEYRIAFEKGDVAEDGIPFITVCLDGGWSKRSYGHNYNASSGAAVIIGNVTRKVLFLGVRNKFCYVCARAQNMRRPSEEHLCFKNWTGSSSAMEADIIMEGFKRSIEMHNLRFKYFIADGDSSTYAKLKTYVSYGDQIEKIECKNHAVKNYSKHLIKIKDDTRIEPHARKLLPVKTIKSLADLAKKQIAYNSSHGSVANLKKDLANGPFHLFGQHVNCSSYYCEENGSNDENNKVPQLKATGLFHRIEGAVEFLIKKSHLLIKNETNNKSEHFMSLLAKYNAGKRLNLTMRGSFKNRCSVSALAYNTNGPDWQHSSWKRLMLRSPGKMFKRNIKNKNRQLNYRRLHQECRSRRVLFPKIKDDSQTTINRDYGIYALQPEVAEEELQEEYERVLNSMQVTIQERDQIASDTVGQFANKLYKQERKNRLTASLFGKIIKRRIWTPCHNDVVSILYSSNFCSDAMNYGKINEKVVLKILDTKYGIKTENAGLFIDLQYGFLAASPDGLVKDNKGLVEVKCLYKVHKSGKTLENAAKDKEICLEWTGDCLRLKRNDNYYYQVQGQLNICRRDYCYFVVYVDDSHDIFIEKIIRDRSLWEMEMLPHLIKFFKDSVLPEIVMRKVPKKLRCIDSKDTLAAINERKEKQKGKKKVAKKKKKGC